MFVCLCKALTENDVARAARACSASGCTSTEDVLRLLGLHCEEACGFCVANPESFIAIAQEEWTGISARSASVL